MHGRREAAFSACGDRQPSHQRPELSPNPGVVQLAPRPSAPSPPATIKRKKKGQESMARRLGAGNAGGRRHTGRGRGGRLRIRAEEEEGRRQAEAPPRRPGQCPALGLHLLAALRIHLAHRLGIPLHPRTHVWSLVPNHRGPCRLDAPQMGPAGCKPYLLAFLPLPAACSSCPSRTRALLRDVPPQEVGLKPLRHGSTWMHMEECTIRVGPGSPGP